MKIPPLHPREEERVAALHDYDILDTLPESSYDDLVLLASQICNVPIALISLIDHDRQWFKSKIGLDNNESPRDVSFCAHAILEDGVFEVKDTLDDERFADHPAVTYWPNIRFYAGTPLVTADGLPLGTLCVVDSTPRQLSDDQKRALEALGRQVMAQLELRRHIEELDKKTEELEEQQRMFNAFMNYSPVVAFLKDDQGRMLYVNRKFEEVFELSSEHVIGKTDDELWPHEIAQALQENDRKILGSNEAVQVIETTTQSIQQDVDEVRTQNSTQETRQWLSVKFPLHDVGERRLLGGLSLEITEQQNQERLLRETLRLQQAILNNAPYAIIATDAEGNITLLNRAAERIKGYSQEQVLGKNASLMFNDLPQIARRAEALSHELGRKIEPGFEVFVARAREKELDEQEWELVHRNGMRTPVLLAISCVRDEEQNITGFLGIVQDISERKRVERLKNEFVSTVSHELRTPLTSIRGSLGLLVGGVAGELPERAKGMITIAHNNAERLVRLINDILDIEKIESGKLALDLQTYDVAAVVRSALEANRSYGENLNVHFELHDDLSAPFFVHADSDRLEQVLANLLSNAAKFSPPNQAVPVNLEALTWNGRAAVRISVEDCGPGVPEEFRDRIFAKFAQADSSDTRQKGGTGLGLAISKSLVEQMGGEIGFTSEPGHTVFFFTLPEAGKAKVQHPTEHLSTIKVEYSQDEYSQEKKPRILICEDDHDVANLLEILLQGEGAETHRAHSVQETRDLLRQQTFDVMTLDLILPDGDGLELLRELRSAEATRDLPVVVVSIRANEQKAQHEHEMEREKSEQQSRGERGALQCASLCIADWLNKPIEQERLAQAVRSALKRGNDKASQEDKRPCILHIEDDSDVREVVASVLQEAADVSWASDAVQSRQLLNEKTFDLILLDLELQGEAGSELLRALPERAAQTPVVIFSATESRADAAQQIKAALVKARTSNEELLQTVRSVLKGSPERTDLF